MKKTKETYFRPFPDWNKTEGCSGLKEFEGEDLGKYILLISFLIIQKIII